MHMTKRLLPIVAFAAAVMYPLWSLAASGQDSLTRERALRDAFISDPPFSTPVQEETAPAPAQPDVSRSRPAPGAAPVQKPSAYVPAPAPPQAGIPEMLVRGYSVDPSGAVIVIGMDGVMLTLDGSRPVKLIFPPEYGLAPLIVGGVNRPASQEVQAAVPAQIEVRGYSIHPSGAIVILDMDGVVRTLDGSRQVTLVFPPEYGIPPQTVGGTASPQTYAPSARGWQQPQGHASPQAGYGAQPSQSAAGSDDEAQSSGSTTMDVPASVLQEGFSAIMKQIQKGQSRKAP